MRRLIGLVLLLGWVLCLPAGAESFEFVDREIPEILYAMSLCKGMTVICDDTVRGKADFRFNGDGFDQAFDSFLLRNRLYAEKRENGWTVSKVRIESKAVDGDVLFRLDACDVSLLNVLEKLSVKTGIGITYDPLPEISVNVHTPFCSPAELFQSLVNLAAGYELKKNSHESEDGASESELNKEKSGVFYHVARLTGRENQTAGSGRVEFYRKGETWECNVQNASCGYALEKLFNMAQKKYSFISGTDGKIVRASLSGKTFDQMVSILCGQSGCEYTLCEDVYLISALKNAREKLIKESKRWIFQKLNNLNKEEFAAMFARRFGDVEYVVLKDNSGILFLGDGELAEDVADFCSGCDVAVKSRLVQLKYLRFRDFFANLPPCVDKAFVKDSGKGDSFYFTGSDESYAKLLQCLEETDVPASSITYDLLIMQYQKSENDDWTVNYGIERIAPGDRNGMTCGLGTVLNLNLDVVNSFGLKFAGNLEAAISETRAHVFADTTLNGVSGSTINFQNTNTYRYRDNNLDPDTGKPVYSGVTREIVSGLKLEVTGTVTGNGMITSKITASVSRQGADTSSKTGNPPPSSEKVITTEVSSRSGQPVILSGLVQTEESESQSRMPLVSRIPLIGWLFKGQVKSKEQTELVIYLVPKVNGFAEPLEMEKDEMDLKRIKRCYREFVNGNRQV